VSIIENDGKKKMKNAGSDNITYDENGNMTSMTNSCGTTNYTWDARNRLVGISGYKPDCTALTASFKYDALGRRTEKTINGRTIQYLYDGLDIVQEIENSVVSANYVRTLNIDEPLARIKADGTVRYYQRDGLWSIIALTDEGGVVRTQYSYDPFGAVSITGEQSENPFQYTGRENDNTGLYYYRARYYSPELQRFVSEDPIGFAGGINFYVYVGNNPIKFTDPLGLISPNWTPGRECIKCDWGAILSCIWTIPATPPSLMACLKCTMSGGRDQAACAQCVGPLGLNIADCIKKNCRKGKVDDCGRYCI
jgi:RHS repeat-associated protein